MKRTICCLALFYFLLSAFSGSAQVRWTYTAKKISDKTYEIHLKASVNEPWHIYSQHSPEAGPQPTTIKFTKNPLVLPVKTVQEVGEQQSKYESVFDTDVLYYNKQVDFVQVVKVKTNAKLNISGTILYMVCNDQECMPPATVSFSIPLR